MDVFDRDWCNLFVWTVNGSMLFHIKRDPDYWRLCFQGLAEFWWSHVIPAKHQLAANSTGPVDHYRYCDRPWPVCAVPEDVFRSQRCDTCLACQCKYHMNKLVIQTSNEIYKGS